MLKQEDDATAKYSDSQDRDAQGRFGSGGSGLKPQKDRVYSGKPERIKSATTKQEVGATGEKIAVGYLKSTGLKDAQPLNLQTNNFPVDLVGDHQLFEVKTGLVSNGKTSQHWRATLGQPGITESAWLKSASPKAKAAWNAKKQQAVLDRKNAVVKEFSKKLGTKVKPMTIGLILNPDKKTVDVHMIKGFHTRVGWNSDLAKKSFVGTFLYA